MTDKGWKKMERRVAAMVAGKRYAANQGHDVDVESDEIVAECKERAEFSLKALTEAVVKITKAGKAKGKTGVVFLKLKSGPGHPTPIICCLDASEWWGDT